MEQWNDVQEKRGSDAEHRNQDTDAEHRNQDKKSKLIQKSFGAPYSIVPAFHYSNCERCERSELSSHYCG